MESGKPLNNIMSNPITPDQVSKRKIDVIPSQVIDIFNDLIALRWNGTSATVYQQEVQEKIASALGVEGHEVYAKGWLDIEPIFRDAGWKVEYDRPGYNENYKAHYIFTAK